MQKYNYNSIDKMVQPIMEMMQEEFPNNCKFVISPHFATIVYEHDEMIFQSEEARDHFSEMIGDDAKKILQVTADAVKSFVDKLGDEDGRTAECP